MIKRQSRTTARAMELAPLVRLWILRILVTLGGQRQLVQEQYFSDDELARAIGLGHLVDGPLEFDRKTVRQELRRIHAAAEAERDQARAPDILTGNIAGLRKLLPLSADDMRVLEFATLVQYERILGEAADCLDSLTTLKTNHALAIILGIPEHRIHRCLAPDGLLARSGLVVVCRDSRLSLRRKLNLLSDGFADRMASSPVEPVELLRGTVESPPSPEIDLTRYGHLRESLDVLLPYLGQALAKRRRGVNILFHGPPGTGKTQLTRALAKELGHDLLEVSSEDSDGNPINGEHRLRAYRAAQTLFSTRRTLIVFDEAEDIFNDGGNLFGHKSTAQVRKAWMNRMLEQGASPAFWLSNDIDSIDPAFVRRFDMVVEVPVPPRAQRIRIVEQACRGLVGKDCAARFADASTLAPAVVTRAASVVRTIGRRLDADGRERAMEHLIGNTLRAQGHPCLPGNDATRLPATYDPTLLNADADLIAIASRLQLHPRARICLYGPPGTGKTAFGRWLAERLDMPLRIKRASDLLSPFVGETEKSLATAFHEARRERALLMIDEVDSFLQDRTGARHSWEITQVNEMLTQMEAYPGVFIASTNLMDGLDPAALRRFDLKVRLDYLAAGQAIELFRRHCAALGLDAPRDSELQRLRQLPGLTPGDFAVTTRRHGFDPIATPAQFAAKLEAECVLRSRANRRPIGFVH